MRASREAAAESRARIIATASRMLRDRGLEGASIADVMAAAGMTHGGFYKHFATKDELNAAAVRAAFREVTDRFDAREREQGAEEAIRSYVQEYLSTGHVERPDLGCPVAALGAEAGRRPVATSAEFSAGAEALIERLGRASPDKAGSAAARAEAIRRLVRLVGAVVVARAAGAGSLRDEILAACASDFADSGPAKNARR